MNLNKDLIAKLKEDLVQANWTVDSVQETLGEAASQALSREQRIPALVELESDHDSSAVKALTWLFILAQPLNVETLNEVLPQLGCAGAQQLGLVDSDGERATALVDLRPHQAQIGQTQSVYDWWIVSDQSETQTGRPLTAGHVLGIGSATLSLLRMTVRDQVDSALDLGCGCGIQALYLSTHAQRVVATDISQRACDFTRFNAALNQREIEVRQGSLFEPVAGEAFQLITSNPPFVITPQSVRQDNLWQYRDGGMDRDNLIATVTSEGPSYLVPGGMLQMLANWEVVADEPWQHHPDKWLKKAQETAGPLQAWVVQRDLLDCSQYAELWMRDSLGQSASREKWEEYYRLWLKDFATANVQAVGMGFMAIHRLPEDRQDQQGILCQYLPEGQLPDGRAVLQALNNIELPQDWQNKSLTRAEDVREERYFIPGDQDPQMIRLTQGAGMGRAFLVSSEIAAIVGVAQGELTLATVFQALSALTGTSAEQIEQQARQQLPDLLQAGMVEWT